MIAALLVSGACVCWALDNQLMALIDGMTPSRSILWKGMIAGAANLAIGLAARPFHASVASVTAAIAVGAISYGLSLVLYLTSAQQLGATRAQAIFASAPFVGAALSLIFFAEPMTQTQLVAVAILMVSVIALVSGEHGHRHAHDAVEHIHSHQHDDGHHAHLHPDLPPSTRHTHRHSHEPVVHTHPHWPDLHHRHRHH
jgi:drug/metabolite transporter (DMT)-like permease